MVFAVDSAGVAELADAQDLGSCTTSVGVQVPSPAPTFRLSRYRYFLFKNEKRHQLTSEASDFRMQIFTN